MLFYTLINDRGEVRFSPSPEMDKQDTDFTVLQTGFPLGFLQWWLRHILQERRLNESANFKEELKRKVTSQLKQVMAKEGVNLTEPLKWDSIKNHGTQSQKAYLNGESLFTRFLTVVRGRQLAEGEFGFLAKNLGISTQDLLCLMHKAVLTGQGKWLPALRRDKKGWVCVRCGNMDCLRWPSVYGDTATCEACKSIGSLNGLQVLFRVQPINQEHQKLVTGSPIKEEKTINFTGRDGLVFEFSPAQEKAVKQLVAYFNGEEKKEVLVWAACGAGKTEVGFPVIQHFLEEGKKVLFAAPRQDVVHDVQPRLQANFTKYEVEILSGAISPNWRPAPLTVATTHQVLRFYRCFDLIIFDEMDAFPYAGNRFLEYGLNQALKEAGRLIYLTATPSEKLLEKVKTNNCFLIRLPIRHHGYPVPVPEYQILKLSEKQTNLGDMKKKTPFEAFCLTIRELRGKGPLLIFVPTISLVSVWTTILKAVCPTDRVQGSWSSDPARRQKVSDFMKGDCDIFICTSILERGVTINKVQVVVLFAHHELYDTRSLIQMAGRTGRTSEHPTGEVIFFASKETKAIREAIAWISEQNLWARKEGFRYGQ